MGGKAKWSLQSMPEQLRNLYQVRGALDGLAAYLCAEQSSERRKDLFASLIEQGEMAVQSGSVKALADADIAFHRTLI
jgi:DNA-binding GntR family transcriptional regulator